MRPYYAFALWSAMVVVAVVNGWFGEKYVSKATGPYIAHLYKSAVIITVIFVVSHLYLKWLKTADPGIDLYKTALSTGFLWLSSSMTFEFVFGHYVFGFPWERLIADYRIWEGRVWSLVLAFEMIAPLLNAYLLGR